MDVRMIGMLTCAVVAAAIVVRILWLLANRVPVLAYSENTDALGDTRPDDPLNPPQVPHGAARLSPMHEIDMRLDYEVGGKTFEQDVVRHSVIGLDSTAPDDAPILWADPANPMRIEAQGPGFWVLALIVVGLAATGFYHLS